MLIMLPTPPRSSSKMMLIISKMISVAHIVIRFDRLFLLSLVPVRFRTFLLVAHVFVRLLTLVPSCSYLHAVPLSLIPSLTFLFGFLHLGFDFLTFSVGF